MCQIPSVFDGFEQRHKEKTLDEEFLHLEHGKLYGYLIKLFKEKKHCLDCFIHAEYTFHGHDWQKGETGSVNLTDQLRYEEKIQLDKKKKVGWVLIKIDFFLCVCI